MMEPKKERLSNFELMRIISMFLIVMWHTTLHSEVYHASHGLLKFMLDIVMCFCIVHVNSLVMLTGYFQCNKKNGNFKKIWKVIGTSWFYKVAILVLFSVLGIFTANSVRVIQELLPLDFNNDYWFINDYIVLFLMSPFLNRIVNYCTQGELKKFVIILFTTLSVLPAVTNQLMIQNSGYGVIHFILIYFIGAYLRKYPIRLSYHFKNLTNKKYQIFLVGSFIGLGLLNIIFFNFGGVLDNYNLPLMKHVGVLLISNFLSYSAPIPIIMCIFYFLFFETLTIKDKWINRAAQTTFGIYLIHDHSYTRNYIKDTVLNTSSLKGFIALIFFAVLIFTASFIIDATRILITNGIHWLMNRPKKTEQPPKFLLEEEKKEMALKEEKVEKKEPKIEIKKIKLSPKKEDKKNNEEHPDSLIDF